MFTSPKILDDIDINVQKLSKTQPKTFHAGECLVSFNHFLMAVTCNFDLRIHWQFILGKVIPCSTVRLWVGYLIYFKFTLVFF